MKLNFFMDKRTQDLFFEYVLALECEFLYMKNLQIYTTTDPYDCLGDNGLINTYIYHHFFGELDIVSDSSVGNDGFMAFNEAASPIIHFNNSPIIEKLHAIKKGKISARTSHFKDGEIVQKSQSLSEFYKKISFWIERNVPLRKLDMGFYEQEVRMSSEIFYMFESGRLERIL